MSTPSLRINWMAEALQQARKACQSQEVPVGAVIVHEQKIIAVAHNLVGTTHDPTAHAEILVLRQASQILRTSYLTDCDLYVTLEPCAMCAQAMAFARIRRLFFGAYDPKGGAIEHGPRLFAQATCHHHPEITGGLHADECQKLLKDFFRQLR